MLTYYVLYRNADRSNPSGIFVVEVATGDALLWDHRKKAWSYNPELVVRFLDDYRNIDRYEEVGREVAERVAVLVSGGAPLPAEDVITRRFHEATASPRKSD